MPQVIHCSDEELNAALWDVLPAGRRADVEAHLLSCERCRSRAADLRAISADLTQAILDETDTASLERARTRLQAAMRRATPSSAPRSLGWMSLASRWTFAAVTLGLFAVAATLMPVSPSPSARVVEGVARPITTLTPGAAATARADELCAGRSSREPAIPTAIRQQVVANYGMQDVAPDEYELDYLITPELGGALDARNLWPQRYGSGPWNALVKDELERLLPRLVCSGRLDLATAQRDMATDWIAAYRKYFRTSEPLLTHVRARPNDHEIEGGL